MEVHQDVDNTSLILNCTDILQLNQLFLVEINGSNPAGNFTIQDLELSKQVLLPSYQLVVLTCTFLKCNLGTHYLQDINTTNSTQTPGQIDISCEYLASNATALGYVALAYSEKEVHYLVTKNSNIGPGIDRNYLKGLSGGTYSTLIYAINESGLPLEQAAAFPKDVTVIGSESKGNFHCFVRESCVMLMFILFSFRDTSNGC